MEGRFKGVPGPPSSTFGVMDGVDGFRTVSTGAAVSARLRVMLRVPVEFAVVVIPTVGAVVEEGVSDVESSRFDTRVTPPRPPGVGCHPLVLPEFWVWPAILACLCDACSGFGSALAVFGWL